MDETHQRGGDTTQDSPIPLEVEEGFPKHRENTHREDISWAFADWEGRDKIICNISDPGSDHQKTDERHVYALEKAPGGDNPHFDQPEDEPENGAGGEIEPDTPESVAGEVNPGPIELVLPT